MYIFFSLVAFVLLFPLIAATVITYGYPALKSAARRVASLFDRGALARNIDPEKILLGVVLQKMLLNIDKVDYLNGSSYILRYKDEKAEVSLSPYEGVSVTVGKERFRYAFNGDAAKIQSLVDQRKQNEKDAARKNRALDALTVLTGVAQ